MLKYSLETLQSMAEFQGNAPDATGTVDVFVPVLNSTIEVCFSLVQDNKLLPRSVETVNDIIGLTNAAYHQLLRLLYDDALRTRDEVEFVDPDKVAALPRKGILARLFGRKPIAPMPRLAPDDPRHPCFLEDGIHSVEANVEWLGLRIDEHRDTHSRLCLLDCRPRWKMSTVSLSSSATACLCRQVRMTSTSKRSTRCRRRPELRRRVASTRSLRVD